MSDSESDNQIGQEDSRNFLDRDKILKAKVSILEKRDEDFISTISKTFKDLSFYSLPIKFSKLRRKFGDISQESEKIFMCMEGEIGVGKSTTNNHIIHSYCKDHGLDHT